MGRRREPTAHRAPARSSTRCSGSFGAPEPPAGAREAMPRQCTIAQPPHSARRPGRWRGAGRPRRRRCWLFEPVGWRSWRRAGRRVVLPPRRPTRRPIPHRVLPCREPACQEPACRRGWRGSKRGLADRRSARAAAHRPPTPPEQPRAQPPLFGRCGKDGLWEASGRGRRAIRYVTSPRNSSSTARSPPPTSPRSPRTPPQPLPHAAGQAARVSSLAGARGPRRRRPPPPRRSEQPL